MNNREFEQKKAKRDRRTAAIGATAVFAVLIALYAVLTDLTHVLDPARATPVYSTFSIRCSSRLIFLVFSRRVAMVILLCINTTIIQKLFYILSYILKYA